jgi:arylsulfatase A-like enzyme
MSARVLMLVLGAAARAAAGIGWAAVRERPFVPRYTGEQPNFLFISVDTLRADHMGVYGYARNTTPAVDAWAKDAVVFENAQASASWTLPGLASVLTSFYSSTHHCWTFDSRLDPSFTTLPEILTDAGYDTMAVTSHVFLAPRYGLQQGFVHFDDEFAHPTDDPTTVITSDMVSDKGLAFLEAKAASPDATPWFLWLHYFDPHGQYNLHPGISEEFGTVEEVDRYDGEVRFTDLHVGRVLDGLARLGFAEHTVVVFLSDHGEEFLDHGGLRHGHALWRELVRVPLIIRAPDVAPRRVPELVRTVDLLPTVLDWVPPLAPPERIEGVSLRAFLQGRERASLPALAEIHLQEQARLKCLLVDHWKLIVNSADDSARLYDTQADPLETRDLAAEHPDVVQRLRGQLGAMVGRAQENGRRFEDSGPVELSETEVNDLKGLGYIGTDKPPPEGQ